MVNRMLGRVPGAPEDLMSDEMVKWADNANEDAWYYLAVQEATNSHIPMHKSEELVPGLHNTYERWIAVIPNRDWLSLEARWIADFS